MKKYYRSFLFFIVLWTLPLTSYAEGNLQSLIDKAPAHGVAKLPSGVYNETIVLSKPVTLEGIGQVTIRSCSKEPVITIHGQHVTLRNINVEQCSNAEDTEAIYVTGKGHRLENLHIRTKQFGIKLDQASNTVIEGCSVKGEQKGNGIDLWDSDWNMIHDVRIDKVRDGIYMENSNFNQITQNSIRHSRYGIHIMFSDNVTVKNNVSRDNITGAMVMGTKRTKIEENELIFNNRNVNAQGLLLYDASETEAIRNKISYNRIGVYAENARNNRILANEVRGNFIGIQFKNANANTVSDNTFIGNVNEAQAIKSSENAIVHNYWDASLKLDATGSGVSAIPYRADPFFLTLTNDVPEYQLFFQAPGMIVLQKLLKSPDNEVMTDDAPLMKPVVYDGRINAPSKMLLGAVSASMFVGSMSLFIIGRKRR
ncbi:NosD domain-containing protein [Geobacillus sp. E263]|uniref:Carbohydrate-binding and sugar hydrolysis n=1 Tax=Geobacillus sp. (strain WCH70) TaxID=471223 RepID=C5D9I2_GEOSW|nr:NosD domain-containing protein [Geobacillus sp. E263]